jgi:hypothetical protein
VAFGGKMGEGKKGWVGVFLGKNSGAILTNRTIFEGAFFVKN